jgi:6,7-dimethyl-8-ribityllumazine synthase
MSGESRLSRGLDRRALIVASRFNESVTRKLLSGAKQTLLAAGFTELEIEEIWVPGAFEIPLVVHRGLATGRFALAVAVGAVIRGETPHFDYIAREASRGLAEASVRHMVPVGFGLLTCDTMAQALARAGGTAGNKGEEAAQAAVDVLNALERFEQSAED